MLHFLLIVLAVLGIWTFISSGRANSATLQRGLRRLGLVLAVAGGALGGMLGYAATDQHGWMLPGTAIGFAIVWGLMAVFRWIVSGFAGNT